MSDRYHYFHQELRNYYKRFGRHDLPWRQPDRNGNFDPYKIMVSEIMLQQTQVNRVIPKYHSFLKQFPNVRLLAEAPLGDVLRLWQGLGYNRRAKFLWQAAQVIYKEYNGRVPVIEAELVKLPGIGKNTAGAILAYAFNQPAIFIETNIRTVYIHHFFADQQAISDKELTPIITQTIDSKEPRVFYWALMDYGSYLKQTQGNFTRLSKAYTKQSRFHGSMRQIRGKVIRLLSIHSQTYEELQYVIQDKRLAEVLGALESEGMIAKNGASYLL